MKKCSYVIIIFSLYVGLFACHEDRCPGYDFILQINWNTKQSTKNLSKYLVEIKYKDGKVYICSIVERYKYIKTCSGRNLTPDIRHVGSSVYGTRTIVEWKDLENYQDIDTISMTNTEQQFTIKKKYSNVENRGLCKAKEIFFDIE